MGIQFYKLGMQFDDLLLPLAVPLVLAVIVFVIPKRLNGLRWIAALVASIFNLHIAYNLFVEPVEETTARICNILSIGDLSIDFDMFLDNWNRILLLAAALFGLLIVLYSLKYMKGKERLREYYTYLVLTIAFANGALLSDNLVLLIIFWEMLTALLFFLITIGGRPSPQPAEKSFVILGFSDCAFLIGVLLVWRITGKISMTGATVEVGSSISYAAYLLILVAALAKAGAIPVHTWLPKAAEGAPVSVMAYLPAALDKILGIYLLVRITIPTKSTELFSIPMSSFLWPLLMIIGGATIIFAVMAALVQHDVRKLLSFHAVSQVGYMVAGIGTGIPIGILGGLFHMINNAIYKCCLFMGAGSVQKQTGGVNELEKAGGLARYMPATFLAMAVAALAISGVPPLNGFASKWMIYQGAIARATAPIANPETASFIQRAVPTVAIIALIAAMFGSALTLASFIKVIYSLFLGRKPDDLKNVKEAPASMWVPMFVLAALCIVLGVFAVWPVSGLLADIGVKGAGGFLNLDLYKGIPAIGTFWSSTLAALFIIVALIIGVIIFLLGHVSKKVKLGTSFYGGENLDNEVIRVPGTEFYETIQNMGRLKTIYKDSEGGVFDPYVLGGRFGERIVGVGKRIHNGILSTYLAFCILGLGVILFFLLKAFLELG